MFFGFYFIQLCNYVLLFSDPPKRVDGDSNQLTIFGLKIGDQGRLNVTVRSNPPPRVEWTVGDQQLVAPQQNEDATITALQPVPLVRHLVFVSLYKRIMLLNFVLVALVVDDPLTVHCC